MAGKNEADELFDSASADELFDAAPDARAAVAPPVAQPVPDAEPDYFSPRSRTGAALAGVGQGASLGFADELGGAAMTGVAGLADLGARVAGYTPEEREELRHKLTGAKPGQSSYEAVRDDMRRDDKTSAAESPWIHGAAALAGGLALPMPGGAGGKVLGLPAKSLAGRALVGAGIGGASGVGTSEGETVGEVATDAGKSAGIGAMAAPVVGAVSDRFAPWLAAKLENASRENALKAVGLRPGITNKAKQLGYSSDADLLSLGAKLRDEGDLIPFFSKPDAVSRRAESMLDDAVSAKGAAIDELDRMAGDLGTDFDFNRLAQRADSDLMPKNGWDPLSREQADKAFALMGKASAARGGFGMADQVRQAAGNGINWKAASTGQSLPIEVSLQRKAYGGIADEILEQAKDVEARSLLRQGVVPTPQDLGASNQLSAMNKRISTLMDAKALSDEAATRDLAKATFGIKDLMTGGAVGATTAPVLGPLAVPAGVAASATSSLLGPRMPSALTYLERGAAKTLPGAGKMLASPAIKALTADTSPVAVGNAYDALMQRFGIKVQSRQELADEAFLLGQSDPSMQNGR